MTRGSIIFRRDNVINNLCKKLSKNIPFVRIDFYDINGRLYFGEITFFPGGGFEEFTPEKWDYELGSWINLQKGVNQNETFNRS